MSWALYSFVVKSGGEGRRSEDEIERVRSGKVARTDRKEREK